MTDRTEPRGFVPPEPLHVADPAIADLRRRLAGTRWPRAWPTGGWAPGVPQEVLRPLVESWLRDFDQRALEARVNALPRAVAEVGGVALHHLRFDGEGVDPTPIVLTNGWPSSFLELVPLAQRLARPSEHGRPGARSFTVVVPSLPSFPFTPQRSAVPGEVPTHELWHRLMHDVLGFERYGAHGGDLGAGTTSLLAQAHPESVIGIHLLAAAEPGAVDPATVTPEEQAHLDRLARWSAEEGAYEHQQMTRPLTLAYGLADSPVGLLAWLLEKYRGWTDGGRDSAGGISDEFLLAQASLYWFDDAISTSFRPYYEYAAGMTDRVERVRTPTALAVFPADLADPPRSWVERVYDVVRYTRMPRGGHFAALEETELLADDITAFFDDLLPTR